MAKLHGFHDAVHDQGGAESGPQAQEQHLATLIAPEGLHRGIIDDLDGTLETPLQSHSPTHPRPRLRGSATRSILEDRPGIADRYHVVLPVPGKLLDADDHLLGASALARRETSAVRLVRWRGS